MKELSEELSSVQEELDQQKRLNETLVRRKVHGLHPRCVLCAAALCIVEVACTYVRTCLCLLCMYVHIHKLPNLLCLDFVVCLWVCLHACSPTHHHTPLSLPLFCPNSACLRIHRRGRVCTASVTHVWCPQKRLSTR